MASTILDLDVGNSFVKWRCCKQGEGPQQSGRLLTRDFNEQQFLALLDDAPERVRVSVVAALELQQNIASWCQSHWQVTPELAVTQGQTGAVVNSYADPEKMGVDRWLAMLAAYNQAQSACCVVDFGSAITVDLLNANGRHLGGYIMPGVYLARSSLLGNTQRIEAQLAVADLSSTAPGQSTEAGVNSGMALMFAGLAQRIEQEYKLLLGAAAPLFLTGGDAGLFTELLPQGDLKPDLVLDGLPWLLP